MTPGEAIELRKLLNLSQTELAGLLGMSKRAWQLVENGGSDLREIHILALERIALTLAIKSGRMDFAPVNVRREALELARLISG